MNRKLIITTLLASLTAAALFAAPRNNREIDQRGNGNDRRNETQPSNRSIREFEKEDQFRNQRNEDELCLENLPLQDLSAEETAGLILMREEEKLAMDVYTALGKMYDIPVFTNIAKSEAKHFEEVGVLLDRYGIDDPVTQDSLPGEYANPELSELYDSLLAQGSESLEAALATGEAIEKLDIADLEKLRGKTDNDDITLVYTNLISGSERHLDSFTGNSSRGRRS